jgi:CheY-like chemotaxis protein
VQAQLVDDLLDVSRIESGRMRLDVQDVELGEVVRAAIEGVRAAVEAKSLDMQEMIDPRVGPVAGDPGRLQQVVWNLLSNAVKFTPKSGRIQVRVERINSHVEVIVADSGQGIDPGSLDSVFDRFWQARDPGQSRQGVGLGLAIVKEIVTLHGGTVSAHSEGPGKGSTFTIRFPLPVATTAAGEARRHPTVPSKAVITGSTRLDNFLILVVDDDPAACDALTNLLSSLGAKVTAVRSAQAALSSLDRSVPDAVISDIGMPTQDGYFLARELRKREQAKGDGRIPLVALTAYGRVEDRVKVFEAGFDNHVVKPVDPAELSAILGTLIGSRRISNDLRQ